VSLCGEEQALKITMLGTGAAFVDPDRAQSGVLVTLDNGRHYLFDCGAGIVRNMVRANVSPADVPFVFLTHLHHDHICDFPLFTITGWMWAREGAPVVVGPKGTRQFCSRLFEGGAFHVDYAARGHYPARRKNLEAMRPEVRECSPGLAFKDEHVTVHCSWVEHIPREICECFGVRLEADGKAVAFSGDTSPCEAMVKLAQGADLLVHECTFPEAFIEHRKKTGVGTFAHTSPTELGIIARRAGVKALVATHFGHFESTNPVILHAGKPHFPVELMGPHLMDEVVRDIRKNYQGPLHIAHDLLRIDV
jgi:ribonuclease Z